ncbi:MAG: hypothetical protein KatS3mg076_1475 [Candidatus Binatia bacterium]|nr:MAG: hypothetical protein KatS3mg076_1475 [Candidatus Binatia bacterium]
MSSVATRAEEEERLDALLNSFRDRFRVPAEVVARAPGRVNLIGEHTDYNGFPVLPMAIERSVLVAASGREKSRVELANADPSFPPRAYELVFPLAPSPPGDWCNYHKAALQGLYPEIPSVRGGRYLVEGNVPPGAGLSSSSALVVASGLAFLALHGVATRPERLAELLAEAERYVGTRSGGMDQAVSLLGREGHALRIDFFPLRARPVPFPDGVRVVVCHSLVRAEKSGAARDAYNLRVFECAVGARVFGFLARRELGEFPRLLGDLPGLLPDWSLEEFVRFFEEAIPDAPLGLDEIARLAGATPEEVVRGLEIPAKLPAKIPLLRRVRHVLREARRVELAEECLRAGDAETFGRLMYESHVSLARDYEVSSAELDDLVSIGRDAGAPGGRLTGAGFGGCTVHLVREDGLSRFLAEVDRRFYEPRLGGSAEYPRFVFSPRQGAWVRRLRG